MNSRPETQLNFSYPGALLGVGGKWRMAKDKDESEEGQKRAVPVADFPSLVAMDFSTHIRISNMLDNSCPAANRS